MTDGEIQKIDRLLLTTDIPSSQLAKRFGTSIHVIRKRYEVLGLKTIKFMASLGVEVREKV